MRRVVTGVDAKGRAVFTRDDTSPHVFRNDGFSMGEMWFDPGAVISAGARDDAAEKIAAVPAPGEVLMRYVVFPPQQEMEEIMRSHNREGVSKDFHMEEEEVGMHTTDTIDYGFILKGEVVLELDDGAEKTLRAGDCYVQNGTRHAWHNRSDKPVTLGIVMLGAKRRA